MESSLIVAPMNQNFELEPGKTYTGKITVANSSDATSDLPYKVSVAPYSVLGEKYEADLTTMSNRSMLVDWITIENAKGNLKPNESAEVNFTITVPETAPAGGQYASILITEDTETAASQGLALSSVFEMASLVYADVAGETVREGEILENNIPSFVTATPVKVDALIWNNGNVHEKATLVLEAKNLITGETILPSEQVTGRYNETIMPETTRRTEYDIMDLPAVGVVRISQTIYYNGETSVETQDVVILPVWFMGLIVILVGVIIGGIVAIVKVRRKKRVVI
ncbi:hypothetical protein IJJ53_00715 [Candidatus Saccharibacteria bacterium]|nr:hypothetical protein [Candidatus Saccharibacteria bacterium]